MGRGRMGPGGGSSRGRMGPSTSSRSRSSVGLGWRRGGIHSHTTVFVGGHHHGYHYSSGSPVVGIIVGGIFALIGLFTLLGGVASLLISPDYLPVNAKYVSYDKGREDWYYRTYDYTVDGVDYTNRSMQSWEFADEQSVGKYFTIYYLESDPNEIYEVVPKTDVGGDLIMIFVGLIFAAVGSVVFIACIKGLKKGKNSSDSNGDDSGDSSSGEVQHTRCQYCGTRYSKNSNNCPQCGASKSD